MRSAPTLTCHIPDFFGHHSANQLFGDHLGKMHQCCSNPHTLIPGSFSMHAELSLGKILDPQFLLIHPLECECVCECWNRCLGTEKRAVWWLEMLPRKKVLRSNSPSSQGQCLCEFLPGPLASSHSLKACSYW